MKTKNNRVSGLIVVCLAALALIGARRAGDDPVRILFIGDSIVNGNIYNFRDILWNKLLDSGYVNIDFVGNSDWGVYFGNYDFDHSSWGGKKTDQVRDLLGPALPNLEPDIAFIHLGTNDRWANPADNPTNVANEIGQIIDHIRAVNASAVVYVAKFYHSDANYGAGLRQAIDNLAASQSTAQSPVKVIDLYDGWNPDTRKKNQTYTGPDIDADFDTQDFVLTHPNLAGSVKMADMLYEEFVKLPIMTVQPDKKRIRTHQDPPNLALNKSATSDTQNPPYHASRAFDGDILTSWVAPDKDADHWLQVDLGAPTDIKGTAIYWQCNGSPWGYTIEVSVDGSNWEKKVDKRCNTTDLPVALHGMYDIFDAPGVRYVRIANLDLRHEHLTFIGAHVGIGEFKVFGETPTIDPMSVTSPDSIKARFWFKDICGGQEPGNDPGDDPGDDPGNGPADGNLVRNGDFSNGDNEWTFLSLSPASAAKSVSGGAMNVSITNPGAFYQVQLYQSDISLVSGKQYTLTFDSQSDEAGKEISVDCKVEDGSGGLWENFFLTTSMETYSASFTYEGATANTVRLKFHCGKSAGDVTLDNITLTEGAASILGERGDRNAGLMRIQLIGAGNRPALRVQVNRFEQGRLTLYAPSGRRVRVLYDGLIGNEVIVPASVWRGIAGGWYVLGFESGEFTACERFVLD